MSPSANVTTPNKYPAASVSKNQKSQSIVFQTSPLTATSASSGEKDKDKGYKMGKEVEGAKELTFSPEGRNNVEQHNSTTNKQTIMSTSNNNFTNSATTNGTASSSMSPNANNENSRTYREHSDNSKHSSGQKEPSSNNTSSKNSGFSAKVAQVALHSQENIANDHILAHDPTAHNSAQKIDVVWREPGAGKFIETAEGRKADESKMPWVLI